MLIIFIKLLFRFRVTGYDASLPEIDIQMALCKHFSSCGEIWQVTVLSRFALSFLFQFVNIFFPRLRSY